MTMYTKTKARRGVKSAVAVTNGKNPPLQMFGETIAFEVELRGQHRFVSIASMAVNTNDCFVGFSRRPLKAGMKIKTKGYDSGTEKNDELCAKVPGPACGGNERSLPGEGKVKVHKGILGVGNLDPAEYGWNPNRAMITIRVKTVQN